MLVTFELKKRHDIISLWFLNLIWPERDIMTVEIPMEDNFNKICFSVSKKKETKQLRENYTDLKYLCGKVQIDGFDEKSLFCLGDVDETVKAILNKSIQDKLNASQRWIHSIHVTDQPVFS